MEKAVERMIFGALMALAIGLLVSPTVLALFHILMIVPMIYFLTKADYRKFPKSAWALLALGVVLILSVLVNQDIAIKGYAPLSKTKYFLFGFLMIAPFQWYFKNHLTDKKITQLLYAFCIGTSVATISGLLAQIIGFNPLTMRVPYLPRNSGLFGMVMNYAHNLSYFLIIIIGLLLYKDQVKKYINIKFLTFVLVINLIGFYFSYTRGAWLGLMIGIPFFFLKENIKKFLMTAITLLLLLGGMYLVAGKSMLRADNDQTRLGQWKAALYAFKERPILGYGYLNFEHKVIEIKDRYNLGTLNFAGHAHNNFFEMLGSAGILGFLSYIFWIGFWFKENFLRTDIPGKIGIPLIMVFIGGSLTQSTIILGINLFFIISAFTIILALGKKEE